MGSDQGWSNLYWLRTQKQGNDWIPSVCIFGDLGNENPVLLLTLQQETQAGLYDMIIHLGDYAYDLQTVSLLKYM